MKWALNALIPGTTLDTSLSADRKTVGQTGKRTCRLFPICTQSVNYIKVHKNGKNGIKKNPHEMGI